MFLKKLQVNVKYQQIFNNFRISSINGHSIVSMEILTLNVIPKSYRIDEILSANRLKQPSSHH